MDSPYKTDEELREAGYLALHNALGGADAVRFIRLFRPGPGDFTEERTLYIGNPSLEELVERIERNKQKQAQEEAA